MARGPAPWAKDYQFLQGDVNSDTMFMLSFQFVQDPSILEGAFSHLGSLLLKLLHGSFVDSTTLVDQVAGCSELAGIDVSNNDDVDNVFLARFAALVTGVITPTPVGS
ncbi:hypothetical protein U0070_008092 [Myodes glareolus]|uniref:Uncharacterized protein n=1 Tax=Myodes glareolus TaxID=447135 RepID=A0AAW0HBF0_MYOGA